MKHKNVTTLSLKSAFSILSVMCCVFVIVSQVDTGLRTAVVTQVVFSAEVFVLVTAIAVSNKPALSSMTVVCTTIAIAGLCRDMLFYLILGENQPFTALWILIYLSLCPVQLALSVLFTYFRAYSSVIIVTASVAI